MKTLFACLLGLFLYVPFATAQQADIEAIRKAYQQATDQLKNAASLAEGDPTPYFVDDWYINSRKVQRPKVGNDYGVFTFLYNYPDMATPYQSQLVFIRHASKEMTFDLLHEYLFDEKGQLSFYYEKTQKETRLYYKNGKLIRYQEGQAIDKDLASRQILARNIQADAAALLALFQKQHQEK